jgi:hypothetical protein
MTKTHITLHDGGQIGDLARGVLSALRATGTFGGESCVRNDLLATHSLAFEHPPAGDGYYYLFRGTEPWCAEPPTYSTLHPAENPGDAGKRDREITVCAAP